MSGVVEFGVSAAENPFTVAFAQIHDPPRFPVVEAELDRPPDLDAVGGNRARVPDLGAFKLGEQFVGEIGIAIDQAVGDTAEAGMVDAVDDDRWLLHGDGSPCWQARRGGRTRGLPRRKMIRENVKSYSPRPGAESELGSASCDGDDPEDGFCRARAHGLNMVTSTAKSTRDGQSGARLPYPPDTH